MLNVKSVQVAHDIVLGSIFYGIDTLLSKSNLELHSENIIYHVLLGMGIEETEAHRIAFSPLPKAAAVSGPIFSKLKFVKDKKSITLPKVKSL